MNCRFCSDELRTTFIDLKHAPPSNAYLTYKQLSEPELYLPLKIKVCETCWLVQTLDYVEPKEIFNLDYAYFSSTSSSWVKHGEKYTEKICNMLNLNENSFVIEIACNDGYLLKNFLSNKIPCLGIEPTESTAKEAEKLGIKVIKDFFGESLSKDIAKNHSKADLIIGNNVYAHVPNIIDFTKGIKNLLKVDGTITLEFPHLLQLVKNNQFDTIYHEHYSYLSLHSVIEIFKNSNLRVWNVEELATHGGSLRVFGCHDSSHQKTNENVSEILKNEKDLGLMKIQTYESFQNTANIIKDDLIQFLIEQKRLKKKVLGYGAAAKGNTLLNYAGIRDDLLECVFDAAEFKQGKYLPGSHIPIVSPDSIYEQKPDYLLVLPWNILNEIKDEYYRLIENGTKFVTAVPSLKIHE